MKTSDVLIHLDETMAGAGRARLETLLRNMEGVAVPRFSPGRDHLVFVPYDPDSTSAAVILGQIHAQGYGARIVAI